MSRTIPDELIAHAAKLIKRGAMLKDAAKIIGFTADDLSKKLHTIGIRTDARFDWDSLANEIIQLYQSGMSTVAIAHEFGAPRHSAATIRNLLIRNNIQIRSSSKSTHLRMQKMSPANRRANIEKARSVRTKNLVNAAHSGTINAALGFGESEFGALLTKHAQFQFEKQVQIDDYLIDFVIGKIAVEIKSNTLSAHISKNNRRRFEHIGKRGYTTVFLVTNHIKTLWSHANDIITILDDLRCDPPPVSEYWVIRCTLEQIGSDIDVDHWSVERRSPKRGHTV